MICLIAADGLTHTAIIRDVTSFETFTDQDGKTRGRVWGCNSLRFDRVLQPGEELEYCDESDIGAALVSADAIIE